jgi:tetratricopeptide (TPR) repeat protein
LSGVGYGLFGLLYVVSKHDDRFKECIDQKTVNLFVGWFVFCIFTTITHMFNVANVAHAAGAAIGWILGYAIVLPRWRVAIVTSVASVVLFGLAASTVWRPHLNLASKGGYDEGKWGYDALLADQDQEAIRWLRDAVIYQPRMASYWFNLGIAYERENNPAAALAAYHRAHDLEPSNQKYADAIAKPQ